MIKANVTIGSLSAAETLLVTPSQQSSVLDTTAQVLNFSDGSAGRYTGDLPFPGQTAGANVDDFVVLATATLNIPVAGTWTFGVNSDDGFRLEIESVGSIEFPDPRGPGDTLGRFTFEAAGAYPMRLIYYERGGGAALELFAAQGDFNAWNDSDFRLVGDTANGGLAVRPPVIGAASSLAFVGDPAGTVASGSILHPQPVVQLTDDAGTAISESDRVVTASVPAGFTLTGTTSATTGATGRATFSDLGLRGPIGGVAITFSADGLVPTQSPSITVTPGPASAAASLVVAPGGTGPFIANGSDAVALEVQLRDADGNPVETGGQSVVLASTLGTLSGLIDLNTGRYTATLSATEAGMASVTATLDGVTLLSSAVVEFVPALPVLELTLAARLPGGAFGPLNEVVPGDLVEVRLTFLNSGNDPASDLELLLELPVGFVLSAEHAGNGTVSCPGAEPTLRANLLRATAQGLLLEAPNLCPNLPVGASGSITFFVAAR